MIISMDLCAGTLPEDNVIKEAVSQHGRKIVVDADKALELFNERGKRHA